MRCHNKGQSVLEYLLLATIIFVAIIVGGPSLIRGVQGYFRMTDESVQDAETEDIQQNAIDNTPQPKCICSEWEKGECGVGICPVTKRHYHQTCKPMNCQIEEKCDGDTTCCTDIKPLSCGSKFGPDSSDTPDPTKFSLSTKNTRTGKACPDTRMSLDSRFTGGDWRGTCTATDNTIDCAVGERLYKIECSRGISDPDNTNIFYGCKYDSETRAACLPSCWEYPYPGSTPCNNAVNNQEIDKNMVNENNNQTENDDPTSIAQRIQLISEVIYRQKDATPTTPQVPTNSGDVNFPNHDTLMNADTHNPYRVISNNLEISDVLKFNSYRNHYVYLKSNQCNIERYCERICPDGLIPNFEGDLGGLRENETCVLCVNGYWTKWISTHDSQSVSDWFKDGVSLSLNNVFSTGDYEKWSRICVPPTGGGAPCPKNITPVQMSGGDYAFVPNANGQFTTQTDVYILSSPQKTSYSDYAIQSSLAAAMPCQVPANDLKCNAAPKACEIF